MKILDIYNYFFIINEKSNINVILNNKVNLNYIENFIIINNIHNTNILYRLKNNVKCDFYYIIENLENLDNTIFLIRFVKNDHVKISYKYIGPGLSAFGLGGHKYKII